MAIAAISTFDLLTAATEDVADCEVILTHRNGLKNVVFTNCRFVADDNKVEHSFTNCRFENCEFVEESQCTELAFRECGFDGCKFSECSFSRFTIDDCCTHGIKFSHFNATLFTSRNCMFYGRMGMSFKHSSLGNGSNIDVSGMLLDVDRNGKCIYESKLLSIESCCIYENLISGINSTRQLAAIDIQQKPSRGGCVEFYDDAY